MKINLKEIAIRDLANGYEDNGIEGVFAYGGKLDVRPPYQRNFIYKEKERDAVIDTVLKDRPLNVMYWAVRKDGGFEVIDGQQRTISICQYVAKEFSFEGNAFQGLSPAVQKSILDYKLMVYWCEGDTGDDDRDNDEKLEWFETINIAGRALSAQELKNAIYHGPWVTDAKRYFSRQNYGAHKLGSKYLSGEFNRQTYLETAIKWINNNQIKEYMSKNRDNQNADELKDYFRSVIQWTKSIFPKHRSPMKGVEWGFLYNKYKNNKFNSVALEKEVAKLMLDRDVTSKKGIYEYLFDGEEKHLNIRAFDDNDKIEAYERQKGNCKKCGKHFAIEEMEADHITPWSKGGKTESENCQMLCRDCNRRKSNK